MNEITAQITILSSIIFTTGIAAVFQKPGHTDLNFGAVMLFIASMINFTVFSDSSSVSIEGQIIGLLIVFIMILHLIVQKILQRIDD